MVSGPCSLLPIPLRNQLAAPDRAASLGPFVSARRGAENSPKPRVAWKHGSENMPGWSKRV
jgi:hypothetical protein